MKDKKVRGDATILVTLIALLVLSIMTAYILKVEKDFAVKNKLDSIGREYIIQLETDGNLDASGVAAFQNKIKNRIVNELAGSVKEDSINVTVVPNTYGNTISIDIKCKVKLEQRKFIDGFTFRTNEEELYTDYEKITKSTSTT